MEPSKMQIITFDIGNTRASVGSFIEGQLNWRRDVSLDVIRHEIGSYLQPTPDLCVLSCVSAKAFFVLDELRSQIKCPIVNVHSSRAPIKIHYEHPEKLGQDRIANALAASLHSKTGAIVVDLGTATHFDVVDPHGEFWGGPIYAGVETMLSALTTQIPHLPNPDLTSEIQPLSQNTLDAIRTGTILCTAGGIERIIFEIRKTLDYLPKTILTGGNANLIEPHIAYDEWVPNLTLEGLCEYGVRTLSGARKISA